MDFITKRSLVLSPIPVSPGIFLPSVNSLSFLGVIVSNDFKWNLHFDGMLQKAVRRIFVLRNLRRSNCTVNLMWKVYESLIRSLFVYCCACFCNSPSYLCHQLVSFERRVCRIINTDHEDHLSILCVLKSVCEKLYLNVMRSPNHPLRVMFQERNDSRTRSASNFIVPRSRTKRFKNSFVKFFANYLFTLSVVF